MTLSTALVLLGVLVLLALAAHAWWKARGLKRHEGPFAQTQRQDPGLDGRMAGTDLDGAGAVSQTSFSDTQPGQLGDLSRRAGPRLDPLIDALVTLRLESPVSGDFALMHLPTARRAGTKPLLFEGRAAEDREWQPLFHGQRYSELQLGVQLANRTGALNEIEYSEFVQKAQTFADAVGAVAELPDMMEVVARARELDAQTSPLDAQLNITLRSNGAPWGLSLVQQKAARQGFVPGAGPGRMVLPSADHTAPPLLTLGLQPQESADASVQATGQILLTLDVPQSAQSEDPFPTFYRAVSELAAQLDATPVDNDGVAINLQAFATIGRELQDLYRQLEALDLAAGSATARRLFA
jgi:hypothetical protein